MFNWIKRHITPGKPIHEPTIQHSRGCRGEELAADYIKKTTAFHLLMRNWKEGNHEIDAIYRDGECLVFVEVRARASHSKVSGYHSLGRPKRQAMRQAAYAYMRTLPKRPRTYRYDSVELGMEGENALFIRHHRNIQVF